MAHRKQSVCHYKGRYFRTIGKVLHNGRIGPKKFLLGTDKAAAEIANRRLEQLWSAVVEYHKGLEAFERQSIAATGEYLGSVVNRLTGEFEVQAKGFLARGPLWNAESLAITECVRHGKHEILVHRDRSNPHPAEYVQRIEELRDCYRVIAFVPSSMEDYVAGQRDLTTAANNATSDAREQGAFAARVVKAPLLMSNGGNGGNGGNRQTLYQALDAYAQWAREHYVRDGATTDHGRATAEGIIRLKDSHIDILLEQLNYDAVDRMADYWCRRPKGRKTGMPIAIDTVRNHLKYLRAFLRWLHRTDRFDWRDTNDVRDAARRNVDKLKTVQERKVKAAGVETWTLDELIVLYRHASDQERLYLLMGLNGGLAQSECMNLRRDEVKMDATPPIVDHIRPKTGIRGAFALWPATFRGLRWHWKQRRDHLPVAMATSSGISLTRKSLANVWDRLLDRTAEANPGFRRLPFKYLRKTSAQLMSDVGEADGETIAIFHCRGKRTADDDEADLYYRRRFPKVFAANQKVGEYLKPMFDAAPQAFGVAADANGSPAGQVMNGIASGATAAGTLGGVDTTLAKAS